MKNTTQQLLQRKWTGPIEWENPFCLKFKWINVAYVMSIFDHFVVLAAFCDVYFLIFLFACSFCLINHVHL